MMMSSPQWQHLCSVSGPRMLVFATFSQPFRSLFATSSPPFSQLANVAEASQSRSLLLPLGSDTSWTILGGPRIRCERQGSVGPKDNHGRGKLPPEKEEVPRQNIG